MFQWMQPVLGRYKPGDWVVYCKTKYGPRPGKRAKNIHPAGLGEDYQYTIDKYWVVAAVLADGHLVLRTRTGKEHMVSAADPLLRPARFWERWLHRSRFPTATAQNVELATGSQSRSTH